MILSVFSLLLSGFIVVNHSKELTDTKTYTINFDKPTITSSNGYSEISIKDCLLTGETGKPALPYYVTTFSLSLTKKVKSIEVVPNFNSYITTPSAILPQQYYYSFSNTSKPEFAHNVTAYKKNSNTLKLQYQIQEVSYSRGYPLLTITLYPLNYNPSQNKLSFYNSFTITITYDNYAKQPINKFYRNIQKDKEYIESITNNPLDTPQYQPLDYQNTYAGGICDLADTYDCVIITDASLNDTVGDYNWSSLINHRYYKDGIVGNKITVDDIMNCSDYWNATSTFNDSAARVREFIKDAYQDWETDSIILGGDWTDGIAAQQIVPYRLFTDRFETDTYDTMACDLYYSNLDGSWYYTADSIWGGGKLGTSDKLSEVYVGRICAYNASMVSNAVNKTIWYDNTTHSNVWLSNCTFAGSDLGWTSTSKQYMEAIRIGNDYYSENVGFEEWTENQTSYPLNTTNRYYDADGQWGYFTTSMTNDNSSIINQMGHGALGTPFSLGGWSSIYNTKPFFGYSQACLCGRFHAGYSASEELICEFPERHAYAVVVNTGYGYGEDSSTQGPNQQQQKLFWDYCFNSSNTTQANWQLGKAHTYSKDKMSQLIDTEDRVWTYAWYSTNYFGDPMITLKIFNPLSYIETNFTSIDNGYNGTTIYNQTPTFTWTIVENSAKYCLQIANDSAFTDIFINITDICELLYPAYYSENATEVSFILPPSYSLQYFNKQYYTRVRPLKL